MLVTTGCIICSNNSTYVSSNNTGNNIVTNVWRVNTASELQTRKDRLKTAQKDSLEVKKSKLKLRLAVVILSPETKSNQFHTTERKIKAKLKVENIAAKVVFKFQIWFKMGHSKPLFLLFSSFINYHWHKNAERECYMLMGLKPETSGIGSNIPNNWATTAAHSSLGSLHTGGGIVVTTDGSS